MIFPAGEKRALCYKRLIHYYDIAFLSSDARSSYLPDISIKKSRFDYARGMRLLAVVCQKTGSPFKIARETARVWASRDGREAGREILRDRSSPRARHHYFCWPLHLNAILSAWAKYVIYGSRVSRTTEGFTALGTRGHPSGGPPKGIISLSLSLPVVQNSSLFLKRSFAVTKFAYVLNEQKEVWERRNLKREKNGMTIFVQKFDFKDLHMKHK